MQNTIITIWEMRRALSRPCGVARAAAQREKLNTHVIQTLPDREYRKYIKCGLLDKPFKIGNRNFHNYAQRDECLDRLNNLHKQIEPIKTKETKGLGSRTERIIRETCRKR